MAGWLASGLTLTISTGILINRTSNATNARTPRSHAVPCPPKEEWDLAPGLKPRPLDDPATGRPKAAVIGAQVLRWPFVLGATGLG